MFRRLLIATLIGILAALAVAAFKIAGTIAGVDFPDNNTGSLVNAAERAFATATADARRLAALPLQDAVAVGWQNITSAPMRPLTIWKHCKPTGNLALAPVW